MDLQKYGISNTVEIFHNLSYEELYKHETAPGLEGYEHGTETTLGAVTRQTYPFQPWRYQWGPDGELDFPFLSWSSIRGSQLKHKV